MSPFRLRSSVLPRLLLPLVAGLLALAITRSAPQAAEIKVAAKVYVMPEDDGYGLTECISQGGACARIVADAWCESHGHAQAISFGPAEDVTGTIAVSDTTQPAPQKGNFLVTCGE